MTNRLTHFAIYVEDISRARNFYGRVFDWSFQSYGPPDFLQIKTDASADAETLGALQSSSYSPLHQKIRGFECTFAVADIDLTIERVIAHEGTILISKTLIPHVGWITKFHDTEGNLACAMQYL